jgi:hypothetical protein
MGLTPTRLLDYLTRSPCELIPEEGVSETRELAIAHQTTLQRRREQMVGVLDDLL